MQRLTLSRVPINKTELLKRTALESDTTRLIEEPTIVELDGVPAIVYGRFNEPETTSRLSWAVRSISYNTGVRDSGLTTLSKIFGFCARSALRGHNYCSSAAMANSHPEQHGVICDFGKLMTELYATTAPEAFDRHRTALQSMRREWVIPETVFTSGIVNKNNALKYHFDAGNFDDVMSCMVVLRRNCEGGFLSVPELDVRFLLQDRSYFLFDGQALLHGVTPIKLTNDKGYRHSVVYYALKSMGKCGSPEEELEHARKKRVEIERRRAKL